MAIVVSAIGCGGIVGLDSAFGAAGTGGVANAVGGAATAGGNTSMAGTTTIAPCPGYPSMLSLDILDAGTLASCSLATWNAEALQGSASCDLRLPSVQVIPGTAGLVVYLLPQTGTGEQIPIVDPVTYCDGANGGYSVNDLENPTVVTLCPCTCARSQSMGGKVVIVLGCGGPGGPGGPLP